jgi:hypothetical protein
MPWAHRWLETDGEYQRRKQSDFKADDDVEETVSIR